MPWIEAALSDLNVALNQTMKTGMDQRKVLASSFAPDSRMDTFFAEMGLNPQERSLQALGAFPHAISQSVRAAIRAALEDESVGVLSVVWTPGYDYRVTVHQSSPYSTDSGETSLAGVVVSIQTRYPFDEHPAPSRRFT